MPVKSKQKDGGWHETFLWKFLQEPSVLLAMHPSRQILILESLETRKYHFIARSGLRGLTPRQHTVACISAATC